MSISSDIERVMQDRGMRCDHHLVTRSIRLPIGVAEKKHPMLSSLVVAAFLGARQNIEFSETPNSLRHRILSKKTIKRVYAYASHSAQFAKA